MITATNDDSDKFCRILSGDVINSVFRDQPEQRIQNLNWTFKKNKKV